MSKLILVLILQLGLAYSAVSQCLIAAYPCSGNANDISGNNFHGVINGASLTNDRFGNPNSAFAFDGVDDFISVNHNASFDFNMNDDFSISLWVKTAANQTHVTGNPVNMICEKFDDNGTNPVGFPFSIRVYNQSTGNTGKLTFLRKDIPTCGNYPESKSTILYNDDVYHHVVAIKQDTSILLYVDNILQATTFDNTSCTTQNTFHMRFGAKGGTWNPSYFSGRIDDIYIYDCAITEDEVDSLYNVTAWVGMTESKSSPTAQVLYPNPTGGAFSLLHNEIQPESVTVYDVFGKIILFRDMNNINDESISFPPTAKDGMYFVEIRTASTTSYSRLILKSEN